MSRGILHNKKRNSALLYEFLTRHASKCLVEGQKDKAQKTLDIFKKYFSAGKPLSKELNLFKNLLENSVSSRHSAERLIDAVYQESKKLNSREIDNEKSQLIKEINHVLSDLDFYNYKVPNYVVLASIQTLLNETRSRKRKIDDIQKVQLEDLICEHLVGQKNQEEKIEFKPEYNNLLYKCILKRFNEKYDGRLTSDQKSVLLEYAKFLISNNASEIKKVVSVQSENIKKKLKEIRDPEVLKEKVLVEKLSECYKRFVAIDFQDINDNNVLEILNYLHLISEIDS